MIRIYIPGVRESLFYVRSQPRMNNNVIKRHADIGVVIWPGFPGCTLNSSLCTQLKYRPALEQ
jgi:hypothetical protein